MEDNKDLAAVVRSEITKVQETLKTHVSDEIAKKYADTQTQLKDLREDLSKRALAGDSPKAEDVQDLQKRLIEVERNIQEVTLRATQMQQPGVPDQEARDAKLFEGLLLTDPGTLRQRLRDMRVVTDKTVRAIDTDLFATGGQLSAETSDRFIDWIISKTAALSRVTTRRMNNPTGHIDRLTVSTRSLRRVAEGTAITVSDAVGTKRRSITNLEMGWAEDVTLTFLEDNIERRGAESHIMRILATQLGSDANDLAWNGNMADNSGGANFIEGNDGWLTLFDADSEVHAAAVSGQTTCAALLGVMYRDMPVEYLGLSDLGFFMPVKFCQRYAQEVSARETALGDTTLIQGLPSLRFFGLPVVPEPHLYNTNEDRGCLTPFSNLYHAIQRQITVDSEWQPRARTVEFTLTIRNDYQYSTGDAVVSADAIPGSLR